MGFIFFKNVEMTGLLMTGLLISFVGAKIYCIDNYMKEKGQAKKKQEIIDKAK